MVAGYCVSRTLYFRSAGGRVTGYRREWRAIVAAASLVIFFDVASSCADTTLYCYDTFGRLIGQTSSAANITGYNYDNADNRTVIIDTLTNAPTATAMLQPN